MDKRAYFEGIEQYRLLAKHEVGQNFLIDFDAAERIVSALEPQEGEKVLEIGSGAGSLTYFLCDSPADVEAIDIDEGLIAKLQGDFPNRANIHYGNAAKWDYSHYDKIVGNLPYYITSLIIERALLFGVKAKVMVFMVQKEAAERLTAPVNTKDYGPLPILVSLLCEAKRCFNVKRSSFAPAPHVDSTVLRFAMRSDRPKDIEGTYRLCQSLFLQRRKTLLNNLKNYLHDADKAKKVLEELGLAENVRPEQVEPSLYLRMRGLIKE